MSNNQRWIATLGALLFALAVGLWAYQAGVAHGIEQSGKIVVAPQAGPYPVPYPYPYYAWHRPWGFGFLSVPFFFIFWFLVIRGLFWRGGCGPRGRFDEWHRQAHARDGAEAVPRTPDER